MTTKSMSYDHPAYQAVISHSGSSAVGANGVTTKWCAFTNMLIKSVTMGPFIATTAAGSQPLLYSKNGTTTSTTTLTALTSASTAAINNALATSVNLAQGDQFWCTHGTDATAAICFAMECVIVPGATVTN